MAHPDARNVRLNQDGLKKFDQMLRAATERLGAGTNPHRRMLRKWAARYAAFTRRRFIKQSRGGGEWPDLKASTKRQRRGARKGHKGSRSFAVLVDTGQLRDAIEPVHPDNLLRDKPGAIEIGFAAKPKRTRTGNNNAVLGDIASFHHFGMGNLPKRPILVDPDEQTTRLMWKDAMDEGGNIEGLLGN